MNAGAIRVPASTSNLGAGFDALGLALSCYLTVTIEPAAQFEVMAHGVDCDLIPPGEDNLILRVTRRVAEQRNHSLPPFRLTIENEIPLARGLGSSAAAIIAGISCYEIATGDLLSQERVFRYALEFEPHPDNLAAALYGGLIAAATADDGCVSVARLKVADGVRAIVVIPEFQLSTKRARGILPATYSRKDAVFNLQRSALTIAALTFGNWGLLREAMRDRLHQPYRAELIPGLRQILELDVPGLFGVALSGAGPAVFAFAKPESAESVALSIADVFQAHGVRSTPHTLRIDTRGRTET